MPNLPFTRARQDFFRARRAGQPVKASKALHAAILAGSSEEVADLITQVRQDAGVQDLAMLPETTWTIRQQGAPQVLLKRSTDEFLAVLTDATSVSISWPSLYGHWGTEVMFLRRGVTYSAHSADYSLTETYLSM